MTKENVMRKKEKKSEENVTSNFEKCQHNYAKQSTLTAVQFLIKMAAKQGSILDTRQKKECWNSIKKK